MKYWNTQEEPNTLLCHFEHYKLADAGLTLPLPLYAKTEDIVRSLVWVHSDGWILTGTEEIAFPFPDDEDVADSRTGH